MVVGSGTLRALLSFILPGLGQVAGGRVVRGLLLAAFPIAVFVGIVATTISALATGFDSILDLLLRPDVLAGLLVANAALAAIHAFSIVDAYRGAPGAETIAAGADGGVAGGAAGTAATSRSRPRPLAVLVVVALIALSLGGHGAAEWIGVDTNGALVAVFRGDEGSGSLIPESSFAPLSPLPSGSAAPSGTLLPASASPTAATRSPESSGSLAPPSPAPATASPTPGPTPAPTAARAPAPSSAPAWARDGRLNLLLVGADAGPDRWSLRTDTMIVLSVQVATGRAALFGIPRNLVGVPLAPEDAAAVPGGRFPGLLNALYVYAMAHPDRFPGGDNRGYRAVAGAVQELLGVPLDGMVVVNLAGFVGLVNALGGLTINVPERVVDPNYPLEDGSGWMTLDIAPGCHHFDGRMALAYARSRHQDSDYGRMGRQQLVLAALRRQLDPVALIPRIDTLLRIARDDLWTTVPRAQVAGLARLAKRIDARKVETVLFGPSTYPSHLDDDAIARIRAVTRGVFSHPARAANLLDVGGACP